MIATRNRDSGLTSYSSSFRNPWTALSDVTSLVRFHAGDLSARVTRAIDHLERMEELVAEHAALTLRGLRMLDVGAGQRLVQMRYFAVRGNQVIGVDRDLVVQGLDPIRYLQMARTNGVMRVVKTFGRKALRVDARFAAELDRQLGAPRRRGRLEVRQEDASRLSFSDADFDFVYSTTVLQYLEHPEHVLSEMVRVLKPGGVAYLDFMPYTGSTGCFDIRMLSGHSAELPPWAHLRPRYAAHVRESAYLNRLRLPAWRELFKRTMPGCALVLDQPDVERQEAEVRAAREQGDLLEYNLEELLTFAVSVVWRKPVTFTKGG